MTVSYQYQVASSTSGGFTRLLFMWKGSLYKLIYRELLLFLFMFGAVSALYRLVLSDSQKREFEQVVVYCDAFIKLIPLSFVLGFYVSYVARRWWDQYTAIPWPDKVMHLVALYVTGNDEYGRMLRRALMRYLNLSLILVLRSISSAVKRRFPTLDHVVDSGFMTALELELFQSVPSLEFNTYWIPCTWFVNLLKEARRSHRLPDEQGLKIIMEEFNNFRSKCGLLWSYDWVSIPLVYTQVVTLATYSFFAVALIGRQYIDGTEKPFQLKIDIYLPVFTILQFFFFMGLLKVAEQLINPFGDDDEDFELNWLIDRHTKVSYLGVDTLMNRCPPLVKDNYFDAENITLPYTEAAAAYKRKTYRGSVANMMVPEEKQTMFLPDILEEDEDYKSTPTPRASSVNLTGHPDSPTVNRRQISGSPAPTPKMAGNRPETILQLDVQESPTGSDQAEHHRRGIAEAMRNLRAMTKCSTPRIDLNRKPFFPSLKPSARVTLQPWPSATNLSRPGQQRTSSTGTSGFDSRRESSSSARTDSYRLAPCPPAVEVSAFEEVVDASTTRRPDEDNLGIVNTAYSDQEHEDAASSCDCNAASRRSSLNSTDLCQYQCLHKDVCQHRDVADSAEERRTRPRVHAGPRFLRRHDSAGGSTRRKGVHWKPSAEPGIRLRRRTAESLPPLQIIIPQTRSSPNLRNLEAGVESGEESAELRRRDDDDESFDRSDKPDSASKL